MKVWEDTRKADEGQKTLIRWTETRRGGLMMSRSSRAEVRLCPHPLITGPEALSPAVLQACWRGRYWHILSFACKHFRKMTWGSLLSLLRTADLAMGQGLCLIDLCVSGNFGPGRGPDMPAQARGQWPLQNSASSALCPRCLSFLCQSWMMSLCLRSGAEGKFFRKEKKIQIVMKNNEKWN